MASPAQLAKHHVRCLRLAWKWCTIPCKRRQHCGCIEASGSRHFDRDATVYLKVTPGVDPDGSLSRGL